MNALTRTLTTQLGLTVRCAALLALTVIAMILAVTTGVAALYGAVGVLAFLAGTTWDRQVSCDDCGTSLEER